MDFDCPLEQDQFGCDAAVVQSLVSRQIWQGPVEDPGKGAGHGAAVSQRFTSTPTSASTLVPASQCPVEAIFYQDDTPEQWKDYYKIKRRVLRRPGKPRRRSPSRQDPQGLPPDRSPPPLA